MDRRVTIIAAADGSALGNPGPTGWGWYVDASRWASGGQPHGTNNIGELTAVLDLLQQSAGCAEDLLILCDSTYVIRSITQWMPGWKRRGWVKGDGKPVQNLDLMKALDAAMAGRRVRFEWVKGHSGHALNEEADRLANAAALAYKEGRIADPGPGFGGGTAAHAGSGATATRRPSASPTRKLTPPTPEQSDLFAALALEEVAPQSNSAADKTSAEDEIVALERALLTDAVRASPRLMGTILHPQWREIGSSGRLWTREDALAMGPLPSPVDLDVIATERLGDDLLLLLWRSRGESGSQVRASLWQQGPTGWQQRFHQGTPEAR